MDTFRVSFASGATAYITAENSAIAAGKCAQRWPTDIILMAETVEKSNSKTHTGSTQGGISKDPTDI